MLAHGFPLPKPEPVILANQDNFSIFHGVSPSDLSGPLTAFTRHMQSKLMRGAGGRILGGSCRRNAISSLGLMESDGDGANGLPMVQSRQVGLYFVKRSG